jgi:glycosyltransferase involved in cell wall biosynthesis
MLSVVLCTHNPRLDYIQRCLGALRNQTFSSHRWEMLLVDNRSDELINGRINVSCHPQAKIIREEALGLTAARLRGIRESKGNLLVFVDDDNVLDPDYLETAQRTADDKPFLGSWSGQCRPEFETTPPEWTRRYWGNLVIREFDRDIWSNLPRLPESMPCGAGLCVRREVALHYIDLHESGNRSFQFDRNGKSLLSGGDNDLAACACDVGLGVGLISSLKLTHLISAERLTEDYLARLCEGIFSSAVVLDHLRLPGAAAKLYKIRWHEPVRALLSRGPHRKIQLACLRGRRRGLEEIDSLN